MKAVVISEIKKAELVEVPIPPVGDTDVLVRVAYSGVCGTDLAIYSGEMNFVREGLITYPARIGHEWSGIVESVGPGVTQFRKGDRVVGDSGVACGLCPHCLAGNYGLCREIRSVGTINCWDGAMADYMLMPQRHLFKLPDSISLEDAALIEPASIALAGLCQSDIASCDTLLIIGTGPIGIAAIPLAKALGVRQVLLCGRNVEKLGIARQMGADGIINSREQDVAQAVRVLTDGKGADVVIEASGNIDTISQSVEAVKAGGNITLIGFYETTLEGFEIDQLVMKAARMQGVMGEFGAPQKVIDIMERHRITFAPLVTQRCSLEEAPQAIRDGNAPNNSRVKILIEVSGEEQRSAG